jgi:hypothetical protein
MIRASTRHAETRGQQRAIPALIGSLLVEYGASMHRDGGEVFYFDKAARKRLKAAVGGDRSLELLGRLINTYAVVSRDGRVVTVAHRIRRLKRP